MRIKSIKKVVFKIKTKGVLYCDVTFIVKRWFNKKIEVTKECYIENSSNGEYYKLCYLSENGLIIYNFNNALCNLMERSEFEKEVVLT